MLAEVCSRQGQAFDFIRVWNRQEIAPVTVQVIEITAKLIHDDIMNPMGSISNISEWCKREACWQRLQGKTNVLVDLLPARFFAELISADEVEDEARSAVRTQKMQNGIEAQKAVFKIPAGTWAHILAQGQEKGFYSPKEVGILRIAAQMPEKMPSEKQAFVLLKILEKARQEAIY